MPKKISALQPVRSMGSHLAHCLNHGQAPTIVIIPFTLWPLDEWTCNTQRVSLNPGWLVGSRSLENDLSESLDSPKAVVWRVWQQTILQERCYFPVLHYRRQKLCNLPKATHLVSDRAKTYSPFYLTPEPTLISLWLCSDHALVLLCTNVASEKMGMLHVKMAKSVAFVIKQTWIQDPYFLLPSSGTLDQELNILGFPL